MSPLNVRTVGLLDVTVRTDTNGCRSWRYKEAPPLSGRSASGPFVPVDCELCGLPLKHCRCRVSVDY